MPDDTIEDLRPTLFGFIDRALLKDPRFTSNAYVLADGFEGFYVRFGKRYINRKAYWPVLDIANVTAEHPGQKAFTNLLATLREKYPFLSLYVEAVQEDRFQEFFRRQDHWDEILGHYPPCFFWEAPHAHGR